MSPEQENSIGIRFVHKAVFAFESGYYNARNKDRKKSNDRIH